MIGSHIMIPMTLAISGMQEEALSGDSFGKSAPVPESRWRKRT